MYIILSINYDGEDNAFHSADFHGLGVTGSMGTFLLPIYLEMRSAPFRSIPPRMRMQPDTLLGISSEAEANFYAYQVCTRSQARGIRFCGYFSVLGHVLVNARRLMDEEVPTKILSSEYALKLFELAESNQKYWTEKYSPLIGDIQDWI